MHVTGHITGRHPISRALRPVAVLAAGAVIATTLSAPAAAAPDDRGAAWLERQLTDGLVVGQYRDDFTDPDNPTWVRYHDYGLSADVAIALDAAGGHRRAVSRIARALAENVDSWTTGVDSGSADDVYAGSVAKAVVLAQSAGRNPRRFGGVDLVERLGARVSDTKPTVGRIEDSGTADYSNTIGQLFAAVGLADAGSPKAGPARKFLLKQQCSQGFFRLGFADKDQQRQGCNAGNADESAPDNDVTALALIALKALPKKGKRVRGAIDNATDWLIGSQKRNGSLGGGATTESSNTNSTGLAAWALGDAGACRAAVKSARWVRKLQVSGDVSGTPLAGQKGAIAYDRAAMRAGKTDGITRATRDQWRRASAQAAPGLTFTSVKRCRR